MDDQITASTRHVLYAVRVIVERQPLDNPWISHKWAVHDLIPLDISAGLGALPSGDIILQPLHSGSSELDLYMADIRIDLHHAEAEAYAENLQSSDPAIYVVLRRTEDVDTDEKRIVKMDRLVQMSASLMLACLLIIFRIMRIVEKIRLKSFRFKGRLPSLSNPLSNSILRRRFLSNANGIRPVLMLIPSVVVMRV